MNVGREIIPARTTARGEGDRGEKRDGTTPGSSRLSRNRKLDRGMWISSRSRPLDSRNRCQSLRIADRAPPFLILLLITSGVPRSRLPFPGDITHLLEQVGLFYFRPAGETSPAERRRDEPLPPKGERGKRKRNSEKSPSVPNPRSSWEEMFEGSELVLSIPPTTSLNQQRACQTIRINYREPRKTRH